MVVIPTISANTEAMLMASDVCNLASHIVHIERSGGATVYREAAAEDIARLRASLDRIEALLGPVTPVPAQQEAA